MLFIYCNYTYYLFNVIIITIYTQTIFFQSAVREDHASRHIGEFFSYNFSKLGVIEFINQRRIVNLIRSRELIKKSVKNYFIV